VEADSVGMRIATTARRLSLEEAKRPPSGDDDPPF
jgi:hypothetical protein